MSDEVRKKAVPPPHRTTEQSKRKPTGLHQRNDPFQRTKPQKKPFWQKCQLKQYNSKASDNRFSMTSTTLSTDSVYEENKHPAKSGRVCTKIVRKSIQGSFAMYPRINGQVSNITLQSILASFFALPAISDKESPMKHLTKRSPSANERSFTEQQRPPHRTLQASSFRHPNSPATRTTCTHGTRQQKERQLSRMKAASIIIPAIANGEIR